MEIFSKLLGLFRKKEKKNIEKEAREQELYNPKGDEPLCWACQNYILEYQKSSRLQGKRMHSKCLRRLKKIAIKTGSLTDF